LPVVRELPAGPRGEAVRKEGQRRQGRRALLCASFSPEPRLSRLCPTLSARAR
jgi:hypothetical protein